MSDQLYQLEAGDVRLVTQADARGISRGDMVELPGGQIGEVVRLDARRRLVYAEPLGVDIAQLDKAASAYRKFAGKDPDRVTRHRGQKLQGSAWALGKLAGVLYEADTDEGKQMFFHRFRKQARPTLAVMRNGQQLVTLGGAFQVTERGIVDR